MQYPNGYQAFLQLSPIEIQAFADELRERPLNAATIDQWLLDWTQMEVLFQESLARLDIAVSVNTTDQAAAQKLNTYRETIWPIGHKMYPQLKARLFEHQALLPSVLIPIVEHMKQQSSLNQSDAPIALLNQEGELMNEYGALLGAQSIEWQGQTLTNRQALGFLTDPDASVREGIWHLLMTRRHQDYEAIAVIWAKLLSVRESMAQANGFEHYLEYRWHEMERLDYTPRESAALHQALIETWSPLYGRVMEKKRQALGDSTLAPWNVRAPTYGDPLTPFSDSQDFIAKTSRLFHRLDSDFGAHFDSQVSLGFIDIAMRANTMPVGGFARAVGKTGVFVMMNCNGRRSDVENLVHEMGHVFAMIACTALPYHLQWGFPMDFSETPSIVMETLSIPCWDEFYQGEALLQAQREFFEEIPGWTLDDAVIEAFQLWVYTHLDEARDASQCDAKWLELTQQYLPNVDYAAHSAIIATGWQRIMTLFYMPIFAMEYGYGRIAGLNLLQIAEEDSASAITRYKQSLLNGSDLKASFSALGTDFFFTPDDVAKAAKQMEKYLI